MKPVAIFRHSPTENAGYFALYLTQHAIPWKMIHIDLGEAVPADASAFSGLVFMGGTMSVNDDLPWIPKDAGAHSGRLCSRHSHARPLSRRAAHVQGTGRRGDEKPGEGAGLGQDGSRR